MQQPAVPLPDPDPSTRPSRTAWVLGLAGLLPFVLLAALQWGSPPGWRMLAASALLSYGAIIVSFLGGIHWGLTMRRRVASAQQLLWGVTPSLLGWLAVLFEGPGGHLVLAASLVICLLVDQAVYSRLGLQSWLPLRRVLTAVATASVLAGAAGYWLA